MKLAGGRDLFDRMMRIGRDCPAPLATIERVRKPSLAEFFAWKRRRQPLLIDGLSDDWPARRLWTLEQLKQRFGERRMAAIGTEDGSLQANPDSGLPFTVLSFADYIDQLSQGQRPEHYLAAPPDSWLPEMRDDYVVPEYCRDAAWRNSRFWLSAAGMATPLHRDVAENFFFQILGRKRFRLYPPVATPWLYSHPFGSALPNFSRFDPDNPDFERFPLARQARPITVELGPGDALYLPSRWWHQVRSLEVSASINFWWANGGLALAVRAAEWVKRRRGHEIYSLTPAEVR
ncbi:MAG TPA: cupin-like domain-containing protein [Terriglobales bacterium]|nr:cupin-like domain-containing protein [Terriglobales bacterium]